MTIGAFKIQNKISEVLYIFQGVEYDVYPPPPAELSAQQQRGWKWAALLLVAMSGLGFSNTYATGIDNGGTLQDTPPVLTDLSFSPTTVNVTSTSATVNFPAGRGV